jgi:hypothetical protein
VPSTAEDLLGLNLLGLGLDINLLDNLNLLGTWDIRNPEYGWEEEEEEEGGDVFVLGGGGGPGSRVLYTAMFKAM